MTALHRILPGWLPRLEREDRIALVEGFQSSARINADFMVMMCLASVLATLGLLQSSTAVVIGAMLVAPLMGPLVAAGFAVVQGNVALFRGSVIVTLVGIGAGLVLAVLFSAGAPSFEPTLEIEARADVDLADLMVALASGMVAAYATGRPGVASTLAGVAIAAALVPPLATVGITATHGRPYQSAAAAALLGTNLVAIILGAAIVFGLLGVRASVQTTLQVRWARRVMLLLIFATAALLAPLTGAMLAKTTRGQARPTHYPLSVKVRRQVQARIDEEPGAKLVIAGRHAVDPELGVVIIFAGQEPLSRSVKDDLATIVKRNLGERTPVEIIGLDEVWQTAE